MANKYNEGMREQCERTMGVVATALGQEIDRLQFELDHLKRWHEKTKIKADKKIKSLTKKLETANKKQRESSPHNPTH